MRPETQRIAIAEACGNKWTKADDGWWDGPKGNDGIAYEKMLARLPDYLSDLNAMHEAEKTLKDWSKYVCFVAKVICGDIRPKVSGNDYHVASSALLHATASQRAEAFLRTIGKWEDDINA